MEHILQFLFSHDSIAHFVIFGLFMLAGINIPISEDLLIIISAVIAAAGDPENVWKLYLAVFLGAYISDWIPYWLGRKFGRNLWNVKLFSKWVKKERLDEVEKYYAKYGILTLIIGRFIPFGVRNCLFAAAGIGRMRFWKFLFADGIACFISNTTLFTIAYFFGKNYTLLTERLKLINIVIFLAFALALIIFVCYKKSKTVKDKT